MKRILLLSFLCLLHLGCSQKKTQFNQLDSSNKKQGHWIYFGKDRPDSGYPLENKIEEGDYVNDRKEGTWIKYYADGKTPKLIGNYVNNHPSGKYNKYYENGQLKEKGTCISGYYTDTISFFSEKGDTLFIKVYTIEGQILDTLKYNPIKPNFISCPSPSTYVRTEIPCAFNPNGENKIYNENNQIWMEGEFKDGQLWNGKVNSYDSDGILLRISIFINGVYIGDAKL